MPDATVTAKVVTNLLIIALGYLIKRAGLLASSDGRVLNRLIFHLTLPAVLLSAVARAELSWTLMLLPLFFLVTWVLTSLIGTWPGKALRLPRQDMGTFVVSLCGVMGSLAYPFIEAAYGSEGIGALAIFEMGNALAIVVFAYYFSHRYSARGTFSGLGIAKRVVTSLPFLAVCVGLLLNASQIRLGGLPGDLVAALASINSPLMLLSLGVYLEVNLSRSEGRVLLVHAIYKYGVGLLVGLFCFFALPYRGALRAVAFLLPLMPTSMSTLVYSAEQDLNPRLAAMLISLSMFISLTITTVALIGFRSLF